MDIAFVSNVVYPFVTGGAQKRIHEIGKRLASEGHDVTVYGRHYWEGPREISHHGMTLQAVAPAAELYVSEGRRSISEAIDFACRLVPRLSKTSGEHDIVVVSVFPYFPVVSAIICTSFDHTPVVTTWHEVWLNYWNDYLGYLAPFGKLLEHLTARVPQHPVAVSGVTADRLARIGPEREDIAVVPNGIDTDRIRSVTPVENGFDVLFVGRLIPEKNVELLLDAFDQVANNGNITLGVIGDGPQRDYLEQRATSLNSWEQIAFSGFLDDYSDVLAYMKAASIFVSPSTREGFGITYLEAMAADCVVIGADHPDSAAGEVIGDGGFTVEPSVDSLVDVLERVLSGKRPSEDPKEIAREYSWNMVSDCAEEVYLNVI